MHPRAQALALFAVIQKRISDFKQKFRPAKLCIKMHIFWEKLFKSPQHPKSEPVNSELDLRLT